MFWRLLISFALLTGSLICATGQNTAASTEQPSDQEKELEAKKEVKRKVFLLLDEVAAGASTLRLPENKALILSSAADLLWDRDEKRARSLFREALNNLSSLALAVPAAKMTNEQRTAFYIRTQQRTEILQMVARHDVDFALELLRASRTQLPSTGAQDKEGAGLVDPETQVEQSLAVQVAANDPKRAMQLAREGLSKGFPNELLQMLGHINEKDSELASQLASDIISKIQSENLTTNRQAAWFALLLLRTGIPPEGDAPMLMLGSTYPGRKPFKLDERQIKDLLEVITNAALVDPPNPTIFSLLPYLMPEIRKRMQTRFPVLQQRLVQYGRGLGPENGAYFEYAELMQGGTVEALLEAAAKAQGRAREMLYEQAAYRAARGGDTERGKQIVNDNIKDASTRDRIMESFTRLAIWEAENKGKLDEARRALARIKSKDERAVTLAQMALGAVLKKDRKLALELLNEALPLVTMKPKKDEQLYALLHVVRGFALVEPTRAFQIIESLIGQANDLLDAASVLNGFLLPSGMFRKGEMVLPPGYSNATVQFRQFGKELAALALVDFERTKAAADKFNRNEARLMARLFIVQAVLSEQIGSGTALYEGGVMVGY